MWKFDGLLYRPGMRRVFGVLFNFLLEFLKQKKWHGSNHTLLLPNAQPKEKF
jgi:hypothetical protein